MDYLAAFDEVQGDLWRAFGIADDHYPETEEGALRLRVAISDIAMILEDAAITQEQALHALREDPPCDDCGWRA